MTGRKYVILLTTLVFTAGALSGCVDSDPSSGDPDDQADSGQQGGSGDEGQDGATGQGVNLILRTLDDATNEEQWTIEVFMATETVDIDMFVFLLEGPAWPGSSEWFHDGYPHGPPSTTGAYFEFEDADENPLCYRMTHVDVDGDEMLAPGDHLVLHMVQGSWCMDAEDSDFDDPDPISGDHELDFRYRPTGGSPSGSISHSF